MKKKPNILLTILVIAALAAWLGCHKSSSSSFVPQEGLVTLDDMGDPPRTDFSDYSDLVVPEFTAQAPQYDLPLDLNATLNYAALKDALGITEAEEDLLEAQGFVVRPAGDLVDFREAYEMLRQSNIPIFVTADTVLHLYHIFFDSVLRAIEEETFYFDVVDVSRALMDRMLDFDFEQSDDLREAALLSAAFFGVGLRCADPEATLPAQVQSLVEEEVALIEAQAGFGMSSLFDYVEDYSQYAPRGHYTDSDLLGNYFRSLMWYGRMVMLLKGELIEAASQDEKDQKARIQTLAACLIASFLNDADVDGQSAGDLWRRMFSTTAFFVGFADDLSPYDYQVAIRQVCGTLFYVQKLAEEETFQAIRAELLAMEKPKIFGGAGGQPLPPLPTPDEIDALLALTQGMRFLGQSYVMDGYFFQQLIGLDYTGVDEPFTKVDASEGPKRGFPRGLDVLNALGSDRAGSILAAEGDTEYVDDIGALEPKTYDELVMALREETGLFEEAEWNQNLYFGWLYSLSELIAPCGEGYPTCMQTEAWLDRQLHTALASWTGLRHDTVLYAKQTYLPAMGYFPDPDSGYVEPKPNFYARLLNLCNMTKMGLEDIDALPQSMAPQLDKLIEVMTRLVDISVKELENEVLAVEDYEFIMNFADEVHAAIVDIYDRVESHLVVDVHSESNTLACLEEGTGYLAWLLAAYELPAGEIEIGVGPVLTYYEFKQPLDARLTDEAWEEMLLNGTEPARPAWTSSFFVEE
ncbi:MAG: DUF3160 domain-containing protein [Planctomycetota bacterium]